MAGVWDNIKKSVGELASKAAEKAGELTREAADKAEELTKLGKIKLDIFQIKREIEKKLGELGGVVFDNLNSTEPSDIRQNEKVKALVIEIQQLQTQLKAKEELYEQVKASVKEDSQSDSSAESTEAPKE